jgi:hypothetical protein
MAQYNVRQNSDRRRDRDGIDVGSKPLGSPKSAGAAAADDSGGLLASDKAQQTADQVLAFFEQHARPSSASEARNEIS